MARPCKAIDTTSKHWTKEELAARKEAEEKLKGNVDSVKPPVYLNLAQKRIFKFIVKELSASSILCNLDIFVLSTYCIAVDRLEAIETQINNDISKLYDKDLMVTKEKYTKDLWRGTSELSLSPQSRAKLGNLSLQVKTQTEDPVAKAINGEG